MRALRLVVGCLLLITVVGCGASVRPTRPARHEPGRPTPSLSATASPTRATPTPSQPRDHVEPDSVGRRRRRIR